MHVRCTYCNQSFNLSRDYVVEMIERAEAKGYKYHQVECINCRKQIKVPVEQMRHSVPDYDEAEEAGE
jgi:uncharacterized protein with PIN domain